MKGRDMEEGEGRKCSDLGPSELSWGQREGNADLPMECNSVAASQESGDVVPSVQSTPGQGRGQGSTNPPHTQGFSLLGSRDYQGPWSIAVYPMNLRLKGTCVL